MRKVLYVAGEIITGLCLSMVLLAMLIRVAEFARQVFVIILGILRYGG